MHIARRLSAFAFLFATTVAQAQSITTSAGTPYNTAGPVLDNVQANQLGGVKVTATWGTALTKSYTMGSLPVGFGIFAPELKMTTTGLLDAFLSTWTLNNDYSSNLTRLVIDAAGTNFVFDRSLPGNAIGTTGSNIGRSLSACGVNCLAGDQWLTQVLYTDAVGVNGQAPVGDLFRRMEITFNNGGVRPQFGREAFLAFDVDRSSSAVTVTPEPSSYLLMGAGLAGMFAMGRRRRRA